LREFYPNDPNGATPIAYIWARKINCEGPGCGAEIPLIRSLWLSRKPNRSVALKILPNKKKNNVDFQILQNPNANEIDEGTVRRGSVTCPLCHYTTPGKNVRDQFVIRAGGADDAKLVVVVTITKGSKGRIYRLPTKSDYDAVRAASLKLNQLSALSSNAIALVPDEELPYLRSIFNVNLLGIHRWGDLFTRRQALSLVVLSELVRKASGKCFEQDEEFGRALAVCLALAVDRQADLLSSICRWLPIEAIGNTFGRQALGIVWDFAESVPISKASGSWKGAYNWIVRVIENESLLNLQEAEVTKADAVQHPLPDDSADIFSTDPPYYDAVPYADLSDFFYVWLKRNLKPYFPDLFTQDLTPKKGEIVQLAERNPKYTYKSKSYFEKLMTKALTEGNRVLRSHGLGVIVFAHKTTDAWETMLQSVLDAGWVVVASWPIDTERAVRLRAIESAALASSIHLVCRPRNIPGVSNEMDLIGDWRDVLHELPLRIHEWMPRLANEGIVGADAIFSCLGPALEIFSRYTKVEKASGEEVVLKEYLEHVWAAVAKEALNMVFEGADATGFEEDARLTAMWLWTISTGGNGNSGHNEEGEALASTGYILEYDAARKIAQGLGAHLERLANLVEIKGNKARLLPVSERTRYLFGKDSAQAPKGKRKKKDKQMKLGFMAELEEAEKSGGFDERSAPSEGKTVLDRVHQCMTLFAAGRGEALKRFLVEEGVGRDQRFWRLAQALSVLYPPNVDEKRWVDGMLARKKGLGF